MKQASKALLLLTLAAATLAPTTSYAKDWIQSVKVSKGGVDVIPIEVRANGSGYTSIKTNKHRFLFELYARATNGERIVGASLSTKKANFFEGLDSTEWRKNFVGRDVSNGAYRTWKRNYALKVPVSKLTWVGGSPVDRCNALLAQKRQNGSSKVAVLNQKQSTTAHATFNLEAVAARKNKAKKNDWGYWNTDTESDYLQYQVQVTCLPSAMGGKISN
ncbi:hypothetical protein [Maritalea sp.]|uniref:hypothetical protein n=1 Tax=Maritalea sp. TaxID=2003361 RepID=UPI003EF285CA